MMVSKQTTTFYPIPFLWEARQSISNQKQLNQIQASQSGGIHKKQTLFSFFHFFMLKLNYY